MTGYIVRRLLFFIPTMIAISLMAFIISVNAPGDPVERLMTAETGEAISTTYDGSDNLRTYWRKKLGLDLPVFYFSVSAFDTSNKSGFNPGNYIPAIRFHADNRYHRWIFGDGNWVTGNGHQYSKGIIRGDFGISYQTRQPVSEVISEKAGWSLMLALSSVLFAYLISLPVGMWSGALKNSAFDRYSSAFLFLLYSLPSFWVATLLLMTFANPDVFHLFPASGVKPVTGYPEDANLLDKIKLSLPYLILPLICYTYSSLAFISRALRVSMIESMNQDYIRTAKAKGLPFRIVVTRHAFRNSLLPLITIVANVFPLAIGGSVILETIFSIPGMGFEIVQSIHNQNYPMIVAVFTLSGFLTVVGYLVSDILYALADPRITFAGQ
jgi:peptide/nickel transport system permease protein